MTPEQRAAIERFKAILQVATQQTGVVPVAVTKSIDLRLPDGTPRTETTAYIDFAVLANWQPPQPTKTETEFPKEDTHEDQIPVSANGHAADA